MNYAVIMAGGSGQRLWPLSRSKKPKQIIGLYHNKSLLEHCVDRIKGIFPPDKIFIVTNDDYAHTVHKHLPEIPEENILGEPVGRDTANAIGLATAVLHQINPEGIMAVFSADQIIEPIEPLHKAVKTAMSFLKDNPDALFTFGIKPTSAHTGFGYLKKAPDTCTLSRGIVPVEAFKEKPNKSTARKYLRSGDYCWNSGIFVWRIQTILDHLVTYLPHNAARFARISKAWRTKQWKKVLNAEFPEMEKISIDFAVMEHAKHVYMCELDCHWKDVGTYVSLAETFEKTDEDNNIIEDDTFAKLLYSRDNIAISQTSDHLIAAIGVENLIIVHTEDATLICRRDETDSIKQLLNLLDGDEKLEKFL